MSAHADTGNATDAHGTTVSERAGIVMPVRRVQTHAAAVMCGNTRMGKQAAICVAACTEEVMREIARVCIARVAASSHKRITPDDIDAAIFDTRHLRHNLGRVVVGSAHLHTAVADYNTVMAVQTRRKGKKPAPATAATVAAAAARKPGRGAHSAAPRHKKAVAAARSAAKRKRADNGGDRESRSDAEAAAETASTKAGSSGNAKATKRCPAKRAKGQAASEAVGGAARAAAAAAATAAAAAAEDNG